jgi:guanylate kinase
MSETEGRRLALGAWRLAGDGTSRCRSQAPSAKRQAPLPGLLFVLSAPSGAGKDAILSRFLARSPGANLKKCVTATTRAPRPNEVDGRHYHFWSEEEFERRQRAGELLEWATVHGNRYGTPREWVEEQLGRGEDIVLVIDVQGGLSVKARYPDAILIFVLPPSLDVMEQRLRSRDSESEDAIQRRLRDAPRELEQCRHYDYVIVNDVLDVAADTLAAIVTAERCRIRT